MVWAGFSLRDHTNLYVFYVKTAIYVRFRDEYLDQYDLPYAGAIGKD